MTFKVQDITWAVGYSFNLCVGLQGPGWLYVFGMPPRGDVRLVTPRTRATDLGQDPNLRAGSGRAPCVPRSREHEKRPSAGREKYRRAKKTHTYMVMQNKHAQRTRLIPGITQLARLSFNHSVGRTRSWRLSIFYFIKSWKTSAVSTTVWMVETQLCKLRGTSDTFVESVYSIVHL